MVSTHHEEHYLKISFPKTPTIPASSCKKEERNSTGVRGFIFNVKKVAALSNLSRSNMLALAVFHLQGKDATLYMRLEDACKNPMNLRELQITMIGEFVPPDEEANCKVKLLNLQMKGNIGFHFSTFRHLIELSDTSKSKAYEMLLRIQSGDYKKFMTSTSPSGMASDMIPIHEYAHTHERAYHWKPEQ